MSDDDRNANPLEQLVDVLLYAPVGLLYEYEDVLPKLVRRGKSQVALARFFGQAAMRKGSASAEEALGDVVSTGAQLLARAVTEFGVAVGLAPEQGAGGSRRATGAAQPAPTASPTDDVVIDPADAGDRSADPDDDAATAGEPADEAGSDLADDVVAAGEPADDAGPTEPAGPETGSQEPPARDAGALPIAGYDQLPARLIVSLLDDLTPAQRAGVRRHEERNRARKTVLAKLDRLDSA